MSIFSLQFKGTSCSTGAFSRLEKASSKRSCVMADVMKGHCGTDPQSQTPAAAASPSLPSAPAGSRRKQELVAVNWALRAWMMCAS